MEVNFSKPLAGWIQIDIKHNDQSFSDSISYTPEDFIHKLIDILNILSSSGGKFILKGFSEPVTYDFIIESKENYLSIDISYKQIENYKSLFRHTESKEKILLTFFRALSKMKSNISDDDYENNWTNEFPEEKFQKLKSHLQQNKKTV